MLNKTKYDQPIQRNPSAAANRRPKRCHLCKKSFAYDKYQAHFEQCYRYQNKKIQQSKKKEQMKRGEDTRGRTQIKSMNNRNNSNIQMNRSNKGQSVRKQPNPQHDQASTKFRIKNRSNLTQKQKKNIITNKTQVNQLIKKQVQIKRLRQSQMLIEQKEQNRKQLIKKQQQQQITQTVSVNLPTLNTQLQRQQRRSPYPHQMQDDSEEQNIEMQELHQQQSITHPSLIQHVQSHPSLIQHVQSHPSLIQHVQSHPSLIQHVQSHPIRQQPLAISRPMPSLVSSSRQILFAPDQPQAQLEQPYDIQAVINNSNSIIEFIRAMNFMQQDQTLSIMVSQLQQLNQIAQQIAQLNLLGRNLAMGNVFAARIHQLQTAIINQIGIALIRGFNDRLGVQFQNLTVIQPQLRVGFSEQQIQSLFPQKFNLQQKECPICLQDMKRTQMVMQLQCKHIFHPNCIKQWLISSKNCPMCRNLQQII